MAEKDKLDQVLDHLEGLHQKHDALKATCDSFGNRIDALEGEREKQKADAAAAAAKQAPRTDSVDKGEFAAAQMRADSAYQAWGKSAPYALHGESLRDFRIRLLADLKAHSKKYGHSDLSLIGDPTAFATIEGSIINDAVEASTAPGVPGAPLRKVTKRDEHGRSVTTFHGDPLVTWAHFSGGSTRFGRINRRPNA